MKTDYRAFTFEELARDDRFRQWVIGRDPVAEQFWTVWLTQNPDKADTVQLARAFLLALEEEDTALPTATLDQITDTIVQQETGRVVSLWQRTVFRVAASLLLVMGIGYGAFRYYAQPDRQMQTRLRQINPSLVDQAVRRVNTTEQVQTIRLEDGSVVQLYPRSSLQYPVHFAPAGREVYLRGQAFFSITKNPKKPFWVYTNTLSTQVLGTRFIVNAYEQTGQANVVVTSGRVSVYRLRDVEKARQDHRNEQAGVILTPNQQVAYAETDERLVKTVVARPAALQPSPSGAFVFDETPIGEVFRLLETTYGLVVIYDAATMKHCYLTANLTGESLFDKLALICKITRSSYEVVDGHIIIHGAGCENKAL